MGKRLDMLDMKRDVCNAQIAKNKAGKEQAGNGWPREPHFPECQTASRPSVRLFPERDKRVLPAQRRVLADRAAFRYLGAKPRTMEVA